MRKAQLELPTPAELLHDIDAIDAAIDRLAEQISDDFKGVRPIILTVMNGGLLISGWLAPRLDLDVELDFVHASRYRGELSGTTLAWYARPRSDLNGRVVFLVDDILDEGYTLKELQEYCYEQGAEQVVIVVLAVKQHDRCVPGLTAHYFGLSVPDRYVFGFGMDYRDRGRNLPGIYAVSDSV